MQYNVHEAKTHFSGPGGKPS